MQKIIAILVLLSSFGFIGSTYASDLPMDNTQQQVAIEQLNINTADASTIAAVLKGVGQKKAEAIIEFRTNNGPFMTVDELALVKGIGEKTLEANRPLITLK